MKVLREILDLLERCPVTLETYGRHGDRLAAIGGQEFVQAVRAYRRAFRGWETPSYQGHRVVGLLFRPEESIEFLVTTFAAIAEGLTVVPFYPNWSSDVQLLHLRQYRIRSLAVGAGLYRRAEGWRGSLERIIRISPALDDYRAAVEEESFPEELPRSHPCAWIFTSGTSGEIPKCTVISLENIAAAVTNIRQVDFLRPGMAIHSPLSTSHIFAFAVVLGILAIRPRRVLFSDVQFLARLPQEKIGKVDGIILVPLVLQRLRSAFYERLVHAGADEEARLARLPMPLRRALKSCVQLAETAVLEMESGKLRGFLKWPFVGLARTLFGRRVPRRLGSPDFVVVGGAKPSLHSMAFLEVMGIRCLQGWGMTETTGALAVCSLRDRFRGAYGTCGGVFADTIAYVEEGELIVEGPQIAVGYIEPDGRFVPFRGVKRTGDHAEFDRRGRLRVLGKVSDRITLTNGLNYNPRPMEEDLLASDLGRAHVLEEVVVIGDGQSRLGGVFFLREGLGAATEPQQLRGYLEALLREFNAARPIDEQIGPWTVHPGPLRETEFIGPSGKLKRRLIEQSYATLFASGRLERVF
jgi:long-chain acyl-CoA synthetase